MPTSRYYNIWRLVNDGSALIWAADGSSVPDQNKDMKHFSWIQFIDITHATVQRPGQI